MCKQNVQLNGHTVNKVGEKNEKESIQFYYLLTLFVDTFVLLPYRKINKWNEKTRNEKRLTIKKRVKYAQTALAESRGRGTERERATIQELIEVGWQQQLRIACAGSSTGNWQLVGQTGRPPFVMPLERCLWPRTLWP